MITYAHLVLSFSLIINNNIVLLLLLLLWWAIERDRPPRPPPTTTTTATMATTDSAAAAADASNSRNVTLPPVEASRRAKQLLTQSVTRPHRRRSKRSPEKNLNQITTK